MRDHDHPWTAPIIAWLSLSVIIGFSTGESLDWDQHPVIKAVLLVILAPISGLVLLLLASVLLVGIIIAFQRLVLRRR